MTSKCSKLKWNHLPQVSGVTVKFPSLHSVATTARRVPSNRCTPIIFIGKDPQRNQSSSVVLLLDNQQSLFFLVRRAKRARHANDHVRD